jgi:hypothetical protein
VCQGNARLSCAHDQYIKAVVLCHSRSCGFSFIRYCSAPAA